MKIIVHTDNAIALYRAIKSKMEKEELRTWELRDEYSDYVLYNHTRDQWSDKALVQAMMPSRDDETLVLHITWWKKNGEPDEATKGYITGRFTEVLMVHFRDKFNYLEIE